MIALHELADRGPQIPMVTVSYHWQKRLKGALSDKEQVTEIYNQVIKANVDKW